MGQHGQSDAAVNCGGVGKTKRRPTEAALSQHSNRHRAPGQKEGLGDLPVKQAVGNNESQ